VALDDALLELAISDPRQVEIVELHFFGGFTFDEIAARLEISRPTVFREWSRAREWLHQALSDEAGAAGNPAEEEGEPS
jgi:RNA polymerase sigma factor (sigma-70 family)